MTLKHNAEAFDIDGKIHSELSQSFKEARQLA